MHPEALAFIERHCRFRTCVEIGSRDLNGSPRQVVKAEKYIGVDIVPGPGVDLVADGASIPLPDGVADLVVIAEVFEHTEKWPLIVREAVRLLRPFGLFIATMAGPAREPHSAVDGGPLRDGEWYENITENQILHSAGLVPETIELGRDGQDLYFVARRDYRK